MHNHLFALLQHWQKTKDEDWVLGTVYRTLGSAYRKAGAHMLINSHGQYYGLLSGGCLEADIVRNARKVFASGKPLSVRYDSTDEDDWSFQLGIGCGGCIDIMLHPLMAHNPLGLDQVLTALNTRQAGYYYQDIQQCSGIFELASPARTESAQLIETETGVVLRTPLLPPVHIVIVGLGKDALPLIAMSRSMGWQVSVIEPRPANLQNLNIADVCTLLTDLAQLPDYLRTQSVNAVVCMSHNVALDARALSQCRDTKLSYIAVLGPRHRFQEVVSVSGITLGELPCQVASPAGLDIGGQLPESIALSILAQCHSVLYQSPLATMDQWQDQHTTSPTYQVSHV